MSRPRQLGYEDSAKHKIESAFWSVLEKDGFHAVTMLRLAQEAGLNRNTVYYHFRNVQEVAAFAFGNVFTGGASEMFMELVISGKGLPSEAAGDAALLSAIRKVHLFARSGFPLLTAILKETLKETWYSKVGIPRENLGAMDEIQIEYILSGLISVIGRDTFMYDLPLLKDLPQTLIGRAAIETLKSIAARHK